MHSYFDTFIKALATHGHLVRGTNIVSSPIGSESISDPEGHVLATLGEPKDDLAEVVSRLPHLFIYGGGHVALQLYRLARQGGMEVDVFDERPEWGSKERYPEATVHQGPLQDMLAPLSAPSAYAVIMTHRYDQECLAYALRQPFSYIGMIGSRTKTNIAFRTMKEEGFTDKDLEKVHAPIGLKTGGDTPFEVAVSIMAQIIQTYTGGEKHHMVCDERILRLAGESKDGILVRVLENKGSSPATPGAMMLVEKDRFYGTIGGGMIEKTAIDHAREITESEVAEYDMSQRGDLDMVCGGKASLLYTVLKNFD